MTYGNDKENDRKQETGHFCLLIIICVSSWIPLDDTLTAGIWALKFSSGWDLETKHPFRHLSSVLGSNPDSAI